MVKILIFRTDRIGDLIVTCPTVISIQKHLKECKTTLITSEKNHNYAKRLNIFNFIYKFPKGNIINKLLLINKLNKTKYDFIFVFDGKERSILSSFLIGANSKVALTPRIKFYYKFFNVKFFKDDNKTNLNEIFKKILKYCEMHTEIKNYDFLKNISENNFSDKISIKDYIHIHLDEKWFNNLYIQSYTNINPNFNAFINFLDNLSENEDVLITTGLVQLSLINELIDKKAFEKVNENIFLRKNNTKSIYLINNPTFEDIESLLRNTKRLISCHGAITHAANSFDIEIIDIIEKDKRLFYQRFTSHLKKHTFIYRENFNSLKNILLNKL